MLFVTQKRSPTRAHFEHPRASTRKELGAGARNRVGMPGRFAVRENDTAAFAFDRLGVARNLRDRLDVDIALTNLKSLHVVDPFLYA
jgi:hypothetical protein